MPRDTHKQYLPQRITLQWHITERCNLRCAHCYQENTPQTELPFSKLVNILDQFVEFARDCRNTARARVFPARINITGGEPFVRDDFPDLLQRFAKHKHLFSFAILTNGTLIDRPLASFLATLSPAYVQVSVEGTRQTHDRIRGAGNLDRVITGIECLVAARIHTLISFTAHRGNFREFPDVVRLGQKLRLARVWADRLIPCGSGSSLATEVLTPDETREFVRLIAEQRIQAAGKWFCPTEVAAHRALQFLGTGGRPYACSAGDTLIAIQSNGDLVPCRRLPIPVGNVLETPLRDLYQQSDLLRALRDRTRIPAGCERCHYARACRGGLRCLSHAVLNDPFRADPGCWLATNTNRGSTVPPKGWPIASAVGNTNPRVGRSVGPPWPACRDD